MRSVFRAGDVEWRFRLALMSSSIPAKWLNTKSVSGLTRMPLTTTSIRIKT